MRLLLIIIFLHAGCKSSYRSRFGSGQANRNLAISKEEMEFADLIRRIPDYYETIGCPTPADSAEALTFAYNDSTNPMITMIQRYISRIYPGFISAIRDNKSESNAPYAPLHYIMMVVRNLYTQRNAQDRRWLRAKAVTALDRAWMYLNESRVNKPSVVKKFSRIFKGLTDYCAVKYPNSNPRLKAIELIEADIFHPTYFGISYIDRDYLYPSPDAYMKLIRKLSTAVERGFLPGKEEWNQRLREILDRYLELYDNIQTRSRDEADPPACRALIKYLESVSSDLDQLNAA